MKFLKKDISHQLFILFTIGMILSGIVLIPFGKDMLHRYFWIIPLVLIVPNFVLNLRNIDKDISIKQVLSSCNPKKILEIIGIVFVVNIILFSIWFFVSFTFSFKTYFVPAFILGVFLFHLLPYSTLKLSQMLVQNAKESKKDFWKSREFFMLFFVIAFVVTGVVFSFVEWKSLQSIREEVVIVIEDYNNEFGEYPEKLEDVMQDLSPYYQEVIQNQFFYDQGTLYGSADNYKLYYEHKFLSLYERKGFNQGLQRWELYPL